jgi:hypothetical protein
MSAKANELSKHIDTSGRIEPSRKAFFLAHKQKQALRRLILLAISGVKPGNVADTGVTLD